MIKPTQMQQNKETFQDNFFFERNINSNINDIQVEFDSFKNQLNDNGIETTIYEQKNYEAYDSIFGNNWISTHNYNKIFRESFFIIYPMKYKSRQLERNENIIHYLKKQYDSFYDLDNKFRNKYSLEGTGSLIFDLKNFTIYCGLSQRAQIQPLNDLIVYLNSMSKTEWNLITFELFDKNNKIIYHTNITMSILGNYFVLSTDCLKPKDQDKILYNLQQSEYKYNIINLSHKEIQNFCGNMIFAENKQNQQFVIMSKRAKQNLSQKILNMLQDNFNIISPNLDNIEKVGGGSARCMLTELF